MHFIEFGKGSYLLMRNNWLLSQYIRNTESIPLALKPAGRTIRKRSLNLSELSSGF